MVCWQDRGLDERQIKHSLLSSPSTSKSKQKKKQEQAGSGGGSRAQYRQSTPVKGGGKTKNCTVNVTPFPQSTGGQGHGEESHDQAVPGHRGQRVCVRARSQLDLKADNGI